MKSYYIDWDPEKGRGIYANRRILPGEVISWGPLLLSTDKGDLAERHAFEYEGDKVGTVAGCISLANHSKTPNAEVHITVHRIYPAATLLATEIIDKGEEIKINYGYEPEKKWKQK